MEQVERDINSLSTRLDSLESEFSQLKNSLQLALDHLLPKVEALLSNQESNASVTHGNGSNARTSKSLLQAAQDGDTQAILRLLAEGKDIAKRNEVGDSALHMAASAGHERAVIVLLRNIGVDSVGHNNRTALHCACAGGHVDVVHCLLSAGAEVNATDSDGNTPLVEAAKAKKWGVVEVLLQRGASPEKYEGVYNSPLLLVAKEKYYNLIPLILKQMKEKENQMEQVLTNCNDACLPFVFEEAVPGFCRSEEGRDAMIQLARDRRVDVLRAMLDVGADVDTLGSYGYSCLMWAAMRGKVEVMKMLLDRGASVNLRRPSDHWTALHYAAWAGHVRCVRLLLDAGAQVDVKTFFNKTPIDYAKTDEIQQLLTSHPSQS